MEHSVFEYAFGALFVASPILVLIAVLVRRGPQRLARLSGEELNRRHRRMNSHLNDPRGESLLEALLVILFCGVVAAAIVTCLSDEEDLVARGRDVRPTGEAQP